MQYIITDGSTFVDLERDATSHISLKPAERQSPNTGSRTLISPTLAATH
jgi:hypothetical protein